MILMKDNSGTYQTVRALLDSCSKQNFISEETVKRLKLKFHPFSQDISGIGDVRTAIKFSVEATIKSRSNSFEWSSSFAVSKTISSRQPGDLINSSYWNIPQILNWLIHCSISHKEMTCSQVAKSFLTCCWMIESYLETIFPVLQIQSSVG